MDHEDIQWEEEIAFIGAWLQANPESKPLDDREVQAEMKVWTTQDGRRIAYCDLTDKHLINLLFFLRRNAMERAAEETKRAGVYVEEDDAWQQAKPPAWDGLIDEGKSRGGKMALAAARIDEGMSESLFRSMVNIK
jgi:hypothetical protein